MKIQLQSILAEQKMAGDFQLIFPEDADPRVWEAIAELQSMPLDLTIWVHRNTESVMGDAAKAGVQLKSGSKFFSLRDDFEGLAEKTKARLEAYFSGRGKAVSHQELEEASMNPLAQGACACSLLESAACVSGVSYSTGDVIRAGLRWVGLDPESPLVSSFFFMLPPNGKKAVFFADCGVNPRPNAKQLSEIALASVKNFNTFSSLHEQTAKVAFLSFSTHGSASGPEVEKVREATRIFQSSAPDVISEGELQFDAAVDPLVRSRKAPDSELQGSANIFIFPDLNSGNIAYKLAQRWGNYTAVGPILQGFAKPFSDLSRGASVNDIVLNALINCVLVSQKMN